jgi:hypothetical protein
VKKSIYFHIGIGKTATTAIQKSLIEYRQQLMEQDFYVPLTGLEKDGIGHHLLADFSQLKLVKSQKILYSSLFDELMYIRQNNIILSSENFFYCSVELISYIKELFSTYNIKIIFFVREQLSLIESTYLLWQAIGYDYKYNIKSFFDTVKVGFDFELMIQPWIENFGDENILVKVFDKNNLDNGIVKYFFKDIKTIGNIEVIEQNCIVNKSLIPCFSNLITLIDHLFPELLNEGSTLKSYRRTIIESLIDISDKNNNKMYIKEHVDNIIKGMETRLSNFNLKSKALNEYMEYYFETFNINHSILDSQFKSHILDYYEESNIRFSKRFLNEYEMNIFLKCQIKL